MATVFPTVTCAPEKGGTLARRIAAAMQPPVAVPAKGGPLTLALVTRPEGAKVTTTAAAPVGSPSLRQAEAWAAAAFRAAAAATRSNSAPGAASAGAAGTADATGFSPGLDFSVAAGLAAVSTGAGFGSAGPTR